MLYVKRKDPRVEVEGFTGDIADGNFVFEGVIKNVSSNGFMMENLPQNFSASNQNYITVVSGHGKHYRLIVVPCWKQTVSNSRFLEVGFKIVQTSWEWSELILNEVASATLTRNIGFQA